MAANIKASAKFPSVLFQTFIVVALVSYWGFVTLIRPLSSYYKDYDPEMPYFMNSLAVLKGEPYFYLDHPGTPVEIIGSAILAIFYVVDGENFQSFISAQLQNPEPFFIVTHFLITFASIACGLFLYHTTLSTSLQGKDDFLLATAISLMYFAVHPLAFSTLTLWSHASFNFSVGTLLLVICLNFLKKKRELSSLTLAAYALAAGILTATMIYFIAWVIGLIILIYVRNKKNPPAKTFKVMLFTGAYGFLGFALVMLPAGERIGYFIVWISNLILHQGAYGTGESGITTSYALWSNLLNLIHKLPVLSFFIMAAFILLLHTAMKNKDQKASDTWAMAIALAAQLVVLLLFDLKHPGSNLCFTERYALPVATTIPLVTLLVLQLISPFSRLYVISRLIVIIFVFAGFSYNLYDSITKYDKKVEIVSKSVEQTTDVIDEFIERKHVPAQQLSVFWTYEAFSKCYSLWFGNEYTGYVFSNEIREICGNQTTLNVWNQSILVNDEWIKVEEAQWDLIFTRKYIYSSYPFLGELGIHKEYFPVYGSNDFDNYGHFMVIHKP